MQFRLFFAVLTPEFESLRLASEFNRWGFRLPFGLVLLGGELVHAIPYDSRVFSVFLNFVFFVFSFCSVHRSTCDSIGACTLGPQTAGFSL
jgi:hypothetical protein